MEQGVINTLLDYINSSVVSDVVNTNVEDWKKDWPRLGINTIRPNAELIIADMVPITDMEIKATYGDMGTITTRFVVNPEFNEAYEEAKGNGAVAVLALIMTMQVRWKTDRYLVPIYVDLSTGEFVCTNEEIVDMYCVIDEKGKDVTPHDNGALKELIMDMVNEILHLWYFIQVCLTNPPIRERFAALSKTKTVPKGNTKKKRGAVRYVKTHYLDPEEWGIIKRTESGRTYSCLAWYVIGHWREYKNGHRVFIKPYWKGTMRNSVEEAGDVSRNRIVAQMEKVVV